ncbi:MAG TPA: thioredoxin domain-containing protein [Candidatus Bathyarchaeia archaeon]|jgi:protein-disulfide isomerase|nr:thioredoxin domain-containing protein [Candidatus Bathyarchaeia archaeon]
MKTLTRLTTIVATLFIALTAMAQQPSGAATAASTQTQKNIEAYLRNLYAFGPDVKLIVGPLNPSLVEGVLETNIDVTMGQNKQNAKFYISKDGRFLFRGELSDMTKDPLAENLAQIRMTDAPAIGDPRAPVTIVEYSDFECPVCRNLHDNLRNILPNYAGKVRVIFKDFPLEQLHPWARTAALAGRCAYQQKPEAFWKVYDLIYDNQEIISAENAWTKMVDYASQSGLDAESFKSCMASPEAGAAVNASHANGEKLEVNSTPTLFVNGRRMVGADANLLQQYINYELAKLGVSKSAEKR